MDGKQRLESADAAAGKAVPGNSLGLGLVLAGAAATAVSVFLPLAQSAYGLPIVGNNSLFQILGWHALWIPFFLALTGYQASQGKRVGRWSLIGACVIAAVGIVLLANDRGLRTLYPVGSGGVPDASQPGLVTSFAIAIYVAGAGVVVAFLGALAFFQSARKQVTNVGPARQGRNGVRETRVSSVPVGDSEPERGVLEAESSAIESESPEVTAQPSAIRSRLQSTWPLIAAIVVVVATVASYFVLARPTTSQPATASQTPPSLTPAQAALEKLLLSPGQINTAMGMTGLTVGGTANAMLNLASKLSDEACQPIASPAEAEVYEGSGWSAVLGQEIREPGSSFRHGIDQFVVSFPSAQDAGAFYNASAQRWLACANRQYTIAMMGQAMVHSVGPVSNTDGTLSVTHTQPHGDAIYTCQRALTVAKNIAIDVAACSLDQFDSQSDAAVDIAHQIAAKVSVDNNPALSTAPETTSPTAPAVAESAMDRLLLSPDQINTAMGATGMTVTGPTYPTSTYNGSGVADKACQPQYGPAEDAAYSGSRESAMFGQELKRSVTNWPAVTQYVVLFASARDAGAFFAASAQSWPACSNRQFTYAESDEQQQVWTVGPVSNSTGILSAIRTMTPYTVGNIDYTGKCERALTVANNVAIDVLACADSPDGTAVNIARQIAAKVPTT